MPRFLRVIAAPRQVFSDPGKHGVAVLVAVLFFEFVLIYPAAVTTCVFRMVGAPGHALWAFFAAFANYAIAVLFAVMLGGWLLYFVARAQKQRVEPWHGASALSYAWMPHMVVVCVGAVVTGCGLRWPVFPQVRDVALVPGVPLWWLRQALHWLPMGIWSAMAARATLGPGGRSATPADGTDPPPLSPRCAKRVQVVGVICAVLMVAAPLATAAHIRAHWTDIQPVRIGSRMPHFQIAGVEREDLDSDSLENQVVLLNFWATWCAPCVAEMPRLQHVHEAFGGKGFTLVALNIEADNLPEVKAFLQSHGLTLPVYADWGNQVQERFGVHTFPTSFLVDRHGVVQQLYLSPPEGPELQAHIEALLLP